MEEAKKSIESALAAALIEMESPAYDRSNPAFPKFRYASLGQFIETARPILAKHGLAMFSDTEPQADGNLLCFTVFKSRAGETLRLAPVPVRVNLLKPQETGSGLTYARRYSISCALGIVADEDDDANLAQGLTPERSQDRAPARAPAPAPSRAPAPAEKPKPSSEEMTPAQAIGHERISMVILDIKVVTGTAQATGRDWKRWDLIGNEMLPDGPQKIKVSTFDAKLSEKAYPLIGKPCEVVIAQKGQSLNLVSIKEVEDDSPF